VHSSTSSSDPRVPPGPWGRTHAVAALLALAVLGGLEAFWRARGHVPSVNDDRDSWCVVRERASGAGRDTLCVLGASRIQCAFVSRAFLEKCPGYQVLNLAVAGAGPFATLNDLAEDESFRGTVLCAVTEAGLLPEVADAQEPFVRYYHSEWSLNKRLNRVMRTALQERLVVLHPNLALERVAQEFLARRRLPTPYFVVTHGDRSRDIDFSRRVVEKVEEQRPAEGGAARRRGPTFDQLTISDEGWRARVAEIERRVRRIQGRGGAVVLLRPISRGERKALEDKLFPRWKYWDVLAANTSAVTIHHEDVPSFAEFACPDDVHLDFRDTARFTGYLADELCRRGVVQGKGAGPM